MNNMIIKITNQLETEAFLLEMSSSAKFDSSVKISELSKGSKLTFSDISLEDEWWVYFKPTNNK
jgi:hypothetical protein